MPKSQNPTWWVQRQCDIDQGRIKQYGEINWFHAGSVARSQMTLGVIPRMMRATMRKTKMTMTKKCKYTREHLYTWIEDAVMKMHRHPWTCIRRHWTSRGLSIYKYRHTEHDCSGRKENDVREISSNTFSLSTINSWERVVFWRPFQLTKIWRSREYRVASPPTKI